MSVPQQIHLNPQNMVAVTDKVLVELKAWFEAKVNEPNGHAKPSIECVKSIHHTRLLLHHFWGAQLRANAAAAQKAQIAAQQTAPPSATSVSVSSAVQVVGS